MRPAARSASAAWMCAACSRRRCAPCSATCRKRACSSRAISSQTSNDTGIIIDPGVGSGLALTREMLQTLQAQTAFIDQMRAAANELGLNFDADAISEAARNINVDEPEKTERKERRWFGKKKK